MTDETEPVNVPAVHTSLTALERPLDALRRATFAHSAHVADARGDHHGPASDTDAIAGLTSPPGRDTLKPKRRRATK